MEFRIAARSVAKNQLTLPPSRNRKILAIDLPDRKNDCTTGITTQFEMPISCATTTRVCWHDISHYRLRS